MCLGVIAAQLAALFMWVGGLQEASAVPFLVGLFGFWLWLLLAGISALVRSRNPRV